MTTLDTVAQILVFASFVFWAYTKVKRQTLRDTYEEIKELFSGVKSNE